MLQFLNPKKLLWLLSALLVRDEVRAFVGHVRYRGMRRRLKTLNTDNVTCLKNTLSHNLSALNHVATDFGMRRMKWLVFAALGSELVHPSSKFLLIGPRTENELLLLKGLGYNNNEGLDLISYSPWVKIGDMHNMPFDDESYDVVICGWTISYSTNPDTVAREIVRVLRTGGIVAVGVEHALHSAVVSTTHDSELIDPREALRDRINSTHQIKELFEKYATVDAILQYDALLRDLPPAKLQAISGLASSQVLFVGRIIK